MRLSQVVRPGPGQYIKGEHVLEMLDGLLESFSHPVMISGEASYDVYCSYMKAWEGERLLYDRTASDEDAKRLAEKAKGADVLVGVGGGKVLDTTKLVAELLDVEYILIPTLAGTCAGYTPVAAVYDPEHHFRRVHYFERAPLATIVDDVLLLDEPEEYLMSGMADTLAKWYESKAIVEHLDGEKDACVDLGISAARITRDILLQDGEEAIRSLKEKKNSPAFSRTIDAIIGIAGCVGGFAGEAGRMAGAHAIHNGLAVAGECEQVLHGIKVGYGILVQLVAEGKLEEVKELLPFFKKNGFAYNLATLGVSENFSETKKVMAEFAASEKETFLLAVPGITAQGILDAIETLEDLSKEE